MGLESRIESLGEVKLVGKRLRMSFAGNRMGELWQGFMPRRNEIRNSAGPELYSIEKYDDAGFFENFDPGREFEKWAAVRVTGFDAVPSGMETVTIPAGLYAVFIYKGKGSEAAAAYRYILGPWMSSSEFSLDHRPHFALMGEKYRNEDPDSEEEIWIPVKRK